MKGVRVADLAPFLFTIFLENLGLPLFRIDFRFAYVILPHKLTNNFVPVHGTFLEQQGL